MPEPMMSLEPTLPEQHDLSERIRSMAGVSELVGLAQSTWRARALAAGMDSADPTWRTFEDAFPTFYEFTNRPR